MSIEKILLLGLAVGVFFAAGTYVYEGIGGLKSHTTELSGKYKDIRGLTGTGMN